MTANQLMIGVIGLFLTVIGLMYVRHLKTKENKSRTEVLASRALMLLGLILCFLPFLKDVVDLFDRSDSGKKSELLGYENFEAVVLDDPANYEKAARVYEKGAALWNFDINAYDSTDKALTYFTESIELFETAEALTARGQLKVQINMMAQAMEDYNRAIELKPELGNAYFNRAALFFIYGDKASACQDWNKAAELNVPGASDVVLSMCNH
jgi:tetratricopeptide (TPR) repeat protein